MIKYPVTNVKGEYIPITNYDKEDPKYKKMKSQHDVLQNILSNLRSMFFNDCKVKNEQFFELYSIFDLLPNEILKCENLTYKIDLKDTGKSYNKENIKFIEKLQQKFGKNINIELYNLSYNFYPRRHSSPRADHDYIQNKYIFKNKINIDNYLAGEYNNLNSIFMILKIKNESEGNGTYFIIHESDIRLASGNKHYENGNVCETLKYKIKEKLEKDIEHLTDNDDLNFAKMMHEHKLKIACAMINYIEEDISKFTHLDYDFCQKIMLKAKIELTKNYFETVILRSIKNEKPFKNIEENETNPKKDIANEDITLKIPNIKFFLDSENLFYNINSFKENLLELNQNLMLDTLYAIYYFLLKDIHDILVAILLEEYNLKKECAIYIQEDQLIASKTDYDTLIECITSTFTINTDLNMIDEQKPYHFLFAK